MRCELCLNLDPSVLRCPSASRYHQVWGHLEGSTFWVWLGMPVAFGCCRDGGDASRWVVTGWGDLRAPPSSSSSFPDPPSLPTAHRVPGEEGLCGSHRRGGPRGYVGLVGDTQFGWADMLGLAEKFFGVSCPSPLGCPGCLLTLWCSLADGVVLVDPEYLKERKGSGSPLGPLSLGPWMWHHCRVLPSHQHLWALG